MEAQSSVYAYSLSAGPGNAVDGNTNGRYQDGSVTHTNEEYQPWWKVDLRKLQHIRSVRLFNRTDCCSDRLKNFKVLISDDGATWQPYDHPGTASARANFPINRTARYVKVQLNGTGVLSLAEVQVLP